MNLGWDSESDLRSLSSRMIWQKDYCGRSGVGASREGDRDRVRFFVGTKAEYEKVR